MTTPVAERPSRVRLTDADRRLRALSEAELLTMVVSLAELYGWQWVHFRPAQTAKGWRTPVQGPLGKGWPDLVLVRGRDRRLMFVELKREQGDVGDEQGGVLDVLRELRGLVVYGDQVRGRIEVHVWRPSDLGDPVETGTILEALR